MDQRKRRKEELSAQLQYQRTAVTQASARVAPQMSPTYQVKRSLQNHPVAWSAGILGSATLLTLALKPRGTGKTKKKSLIALTLGGAFSLAKPFVLKWALAHAQEKFLPDLLHQIRENNTPRY